MFGKNKPVDTSPPPVTAGGEHAWLGTLVSRWLGYGYSIMHPYTAGRFVWSILSGIGISYTYVRGFVRGEDKAELLRGSDALIKRHDNLTKHRWWGVLFALAVDLLAWVIGSRMSGHPGSVTALWVVLHITALFWIGRTGPVLQKVQTARMVGDLFIRHVVDQITLPAAEIKLGSTSTIVQPVQQLATGKGYDVIVRVHPKGNPNKLVENPGDAAHLLQKGEKTVYTYGVKVDKSLVRILVLKGDPWDAAPTRSALLDAPRPVNLWREFAHLGFIPDGSPYLRKMIEAGDGAGCLAGGAPRKGKSTFLSNLLVPIMLHEGSNIHMIDGKAVDFYGIRELCSTYIGEVDMEDTELLAKTTDALREIKKEIQRRRVLLRKLGKAHITEELYYSHGLTLEWLFIDELATFTEEMMVFHKKEVMAFLELLQWIVSKGPSFGILTVLATQRPSDKSIPDVIRSLIVWRVAFYIASQPGSLAITGKAGINFRADLLDVNQKGVAITTDAGQVRMNLTTSDDLVRIALFATDMRRGSGRLPSQPEPLGVWPVMVAAVLEVFAARGNPAWLRTSELVEALNLKNAKELSVALPVTSIRSRVDGDQFWGYSRADLLAVPRMPSRGVNGSSQPSDPSRLETPQDGSRSGGVTGATDTDGNETRWIAQREPNNDEGE